MVAEPICGKFSQTKFHSPETTNSLEIYLPAVLLVTLTKLNSPIGQNKNRYCSLLNPVCHVGERPGDIAGAGGLSAGEPGTTNVSC